jgi:type II secretory pathway component PulK
MMTVKGKKLKVIKRGLKPFTFHFSPFTSEKGIALMMVLWVLVLLSIISLNYFRSNRWNSASTRNLKEETLSYYMAMSGYQEAVNYILSDKDPSLDFIDNEGNFWTGVETEPVTGKRTTEDGEVEIHISDESAKININYADEIRLSKLFMYMAIPEAEIAGLVDCIMDWKDTDDLQRLSGAENDYYEGLSDPYKAKNMFFDVPEELALVKGMKPEYFKDGNAGNSLLKLITTFGNNTININMVSREVMQVLGFDESEIEAIMKQRTRESGGFRFTPQPFSAKGLNALVSQNFRIEVTAKLANGGMAMKIVAVLNRKPDVKGFKVQTVYWREDAEAIRG